MGYVHVLKDEGQEICSHCNLVGDKETATWEEFLNGCWVAAPPDREGFFKVALKGDREVFLEARPSKANKKKFVWEDETLRNKVSVRWSHPVPTFPDTK